jgi:hypothetical protein
MKRHPVLLRLTLIVMLWGLFAAFVCFTSAQLPDRVATHFNASGIPNGWMTRGTHIEFTLIMGVVIPAFILGIFALVRRFHGLMNIPYKDYWLAPERRQQTLDFIQRQGFRFAAMFIVFVAGIHWSILCANRQAPAILSNTQVGWIAGAFTAAAALWVVVFIVHFFRKPA